MIEHEKEIAFVHRKFAEHYARTALEVPEKIEQREWGFGGWDKKIEARHFRFPDAKSLRGYLAVNAPLYCSYSVAYYKEADARPIEKKGWLGAEVVFDLDADHLDLPCIRRHGKGWVCDECLDAVKAQTLRLIEDFLVPDFGVKEEEMKVNFSGNRGYHVHVLSEDMKRLSAYGRREMMDYVSGTGLDFDKFFGKEGAKLVGPKPSDAGWAGKVARYAMERDLTGILPRNAVTKPERLEAFRRGVERGNWDVVKIAKKVEVWRAFVDSLGLKLGGEVDKQVTGDVTKLIRAPDTLHGETALLAKRMKLGGLEKFDPLKDAVAFGSKNEIEIEIQASPAVRFGDETFGPFKNERRKLPERVALYLICKKSAKLA
ncbi:DNA primase small subunit PriS [Candidatus Burarchaeum australiense]|nr:DNA primase small subunit PriS [Candidatus Burarchaeum australiense]